jgi:AcrR family transcriptional regulator
MTASPHSSPDVSQTDEFVHDLYRQGISDRHRDIIEAAATLFAERGYAATSVRDIGKKVGLLGGSLYYHIKSKEALFVQVHELAMQEVAARILAEVKPVADPWQKLEVACITLLKNHLNPRSITMPLMNDFNSVPREVRERLVAKRDEFEGIFANLIDDLPLDKNLDRGLYRLLLLTLLNSVSVWYREGRLSPEDIGRQIAAIFRH